LFAGGKRRVSAPIFFRMVVSNFCAPPGSPICDLLDYRY
jgi:hypothetical protein